MLNLDGYLMSERIRDIAEYTRLRFADKSMFRTPEALSLYEQDSMPAAQIKELCEQVYGTELYEPADSYVPSCIINFYAGTGYVPVNYQAMKKSVTLVYLPELKVQKKHYPDHAEVCRPTTIYYYMDHYRRHYGVHRCLRDIPPKMLFDLIIREAIETGAADVTITNTADATVVYYNVNKQKKWSRYRFSHAVLDLIVKFVTIRSPMDRGSRKPKALDIDLTPDYRGRVEINQKFNGQMVTIRILPNASFSTDVESLSLTREAADWLLDNELDMVRGLRLIVGETMSGKNTTALALLRRLVETDRYKVVSVEIPVEQELPGVEQINCDTPEDYRDNIRSLIRVNPDFVYITEIKDETALDTVKITNTGKCVLATAHANSVGDAVVRLMDMSGLSQDRVIQTLHSIVYQELLSDQENNRLCPRCRYVRFTPELKYMLYGRSLGEMMKIIQDYEEGDVWTYTRHIAQ